ncbi:acyl-CoA thioesterase [Tepidibacillus infernus]|nr:thioesterase family protein [Tepidibacillus decaturensis]
MEWTETPIRVRYQETDQMGVVYHANYFVWFEVARTEMIKKFGISYKKLEEKGLLLPVFDVSCKYKVAAKYDDDLLIQARLKAYSSLRMTFEYQVIRVTDERLLAIGETSHVWIDKNFKPVRLEKVAPEIHQTLISLVNR